MRPQVKVNVLAILHKSTKESGMEQALVAVYDHQDQAHQAFNAA
jgi:hypothetical protein